MNTKEAVGRLLQKGHRIEGQTFSGTGFVVLRQEQHGQQGLWVLPAVEEVKHQAGQGEAGLPGTVDQARATAETLLDWAEIDFVRFASPANPGLFFRVTDYDPDDRETLLNMAVQMFSLSDETLSELLGHPATYLTLTVADWQRVLIAMAGL